MKKEIVAKTNSDLVVPAVNPASLQAETLIAQAISTGASVETIERLLNMRRELKAEFAKEAYDKAMSAFQMECPIIRKKKDGGSTRAGKVAYKYAPIEDIVSQAQPYIGKYGFSYAIKTKTEADRVKVTCITTHSAGHSEATDMEVPLGTKTDIMSAPQVVAAAITFAKRYAFCNAFGIITGDEDNDAETKKPQAQSGKIEQALELISKSDDPGKLTEYLGKLKIGRMPEQDKKKLVEATERRLNQISTESDNQSK